MEVKRRKEGKLAIADQDIVIELYHDVGKLLYGDDEVVSITEESGMDISNYVEASKSLGYSKKSAVDKTSAIAPEPLFEGVEFLKRTFYVLEYKGKEYAVMKLSMVSVYKMLFFREPKSTITESEWFVQVFRNAQYEIAFHGEKFYHQMELFLENYRDEFGVQSVIEDWSYWMEKFLSGVPPYQYA